MLRAMSKVVERGASIGASFGNRLGGCVRLRAVVTVKGSA